MTYPPLGTLKPVADDVWIVDGPLIRFGPPGMRAPFPTRMTIVRLSGARLFLHSPTASTPALLDAVRNIGTPAFIIGPNRIHYWWIPEWHAAFPGATVYLAPRIVEQAAGRIDFAHEPLDRAGGYPWDDEVATLPVRGDYMTEVDFFHRRSSTLILTDLIERLEPSKLPSFLLRGLVRLARVAYPGGSMPMDMRLTFWRHRTAMREAVKTMVAWNPERIILSQGRWIERDGARELQRAFSWLLV